MNSKTEELMENQKYLDNLLEEVWKNDFSKCEEMTNLLESIIVYNVSDIKTNIKEFVLTAFKLGYHYGFQDGEKPQKDESHNKLMKTSEETLALMQKVMNTLNIK